MGSLTQRGIYHDLLRFFILKGHNMYVVFPRERRLGLNTETYEEEGAHVLGVKTLNLQKASIIEKGIGQVLVESQFKNAIKRYWKNETFDLILYSTPPITLMGTIMYLKKSNPSAKSYLLLKDIFPQNAVDIGLISKNGIKGILYKYFRNKEKKLYRVSDYIGCMSPANVNYLLDNNPDVKSSRVEVAPNSLELVTSVYEPGQQNAERYYIRKKYNLPTDKPIFIYGGNLGKPQGIPFLLECLKVNSIRNDCHFIVVGSGTELPRLKAWKAENPQTCVTVMEGLPKKDYDMLVKSCDVGLIFLDHRFTIPNFPSRFLSYLENKMPVICATDPNTDMGAIADENGFGFWCESNSVEAFTVILDKMIQSDRKSMGEKGYDYLKKNFLVENTYNAIMSHV